jgi:hypothetical protein
VNLEPGIHGTPALIAADIETRAPRCQTLLWAREAKGHGAMSGIGRKIIYAMLVIVVLLVIWQFLGSL